MIVLRKNVKKNSQTFTKESSLSQNNQTKNKLILEEKHT